MGGRRVVAGFLALSVWVPTALAGGGAGELSLDRAAVRSLLVAELPAPVKVELPALGPVTVKLLPPDTVSFESDAVEVSLGILLVEPGLKASARFRLRPQVDSKADIVRLTTVQARGEGVLAAFPDLAMLLPPIDLPRTFDWVLMGQAGARTPVATRVESVEVQKDRVVIKLAFETRTSKKM
jgi:hypothetical protein